MDEISKEDWKLFREKLPLWQERYMEQLLKEYADIIAKPENASDRFWELNNKIKADAKNPGVQVCMRKSDVLINLMSLLGNGVIEFSDLDGFSESVITDLKRVVD